MPHAYALNRALGAFAGRALTQDVVLVCRACTDTASDVVLVVLVKQQSKCQNDVPTKQMLSAPHFLNLHIRARAHTHTHTE